MRCFLWNEHNKASNTEAIRQAFQILIPECRKEATARVREVQQWELQFNVNYTRKPWANRGYHLFKWCVRMLPKNNIKLYYHDSWRPLTHNSTDEMELSVTVIRLIGCKWNIYTEFCERDTVGEYM